MNRLLFEPREIADGRATFGGVRADHVVGVLHGEVGQTLKTGVVDGKVGTSVIERIEGERANDESGIASATLRVTVRCEHDSDAPAPWADLILVLPRPRVLKRLLPQLATLGVGRIVLVGGEKTEKAYWGAQLLREEIYRPFLVEGLMQAGTSALPRISCERSVRRWFENGRFEREFALSPRRVIAHPYDAERGAPFNPDSFTRRESSAASHEPRTTSREPRAASHEPRTTNREPRAANHDRPLIAIGPEGGWTDDEVALFDSHGFARLSLGSRILRTDTACVAVLSLLSWLNSYGR